MALGDHVRWTGGSGIIRGIGSEAFSPCGALYACAVCGDFI